MTVNILAFGEYHQVIHVISLLDTSFAQSCSTSFQHNKVKTIKKKITKEPHRSFTRLSKPFLTFFFCICLIQTAKFNMILVDVSNSQRSFNIPSKRFVQHFPQYICKIKTLFRDTLLSIYILTINVKFACFTNFDALEY